MLTTRLAQAVWNPSLHELPPWKAYPLRWARTLWLLGRELAEGQLSMRAMSLVYTTLLSLIPLLAVSFSVLKAFDVHNQIEPVLLNFLTPLGPKGEEITATIIGFVDNMRVGVLGTMGLALLFYTVVSLIQKIERAFNYTWHVSQSRAFVERFSGYLSVLLVGPVLVFSALGTTASFMNSEIVQGLSALPVLGWVIETLGKLIPYFFIIIAFTFVYVFVPNTRVRLGSAVIGALVAGVLWQTIGWGFASFVVNSTKYAAIYSGFAILILFMIWLYLAWLILLIGATIAFYHQHPEQLYAGRHKRPCPGNRQREWVGLQTLCLIARHHFDGMPAPSAAQMAGALAVPTAVIEDALTLLRRSGLVVVDETGESYLPGQAPERMAVEKVLEALRQSAEGPEAGRGDPTYDEVAQVFDRLDRATGEALAGLSVRELVLDEPAAPHFDGTPPPSVASERRAAPRVEPATTRGE